MIVEPLLSIVASFDRSVMSESESPRPRFFDRLVRRKQYRVTRPFLSRFTCMLRPEAGSDIAQLVTIEDCNMGGAALVLHPGAVHEPAFNTHCHLTFADEVEGTERHIVAYVRHARRENEGWSIGVSFLDLDGQIGSMTGDWWQVFNRRRTLRTVYAANERLVVRLLSPGLSLDARLHDVSAEGVCLECPSMHLAQLDSVPSCRVHMGDVPGLEGLQALPASFRHVTTVGSQIRFGAAWKHEQASDWEEVRGVIVRHIDERQRRRRGIGAH